MGALLTLIRGAGPNEEEPVDIPVDFSGAQPTDDEREIYQYIIQVMQPAAGYLESLKGYVGCQDEIRKAISNPGKESEDAAWAAVCPAVLSLREYYEFAMQLEEAFPRLLAFLCTGDVLRNLEVRQATAKQFADVLHFVSLFDELKMGNPNVQNDFSYYRRTLSRMRMSNSQQNVVVPDELANRMSLFYAHATPMTKALVDATMKLVKENSNVPPGEVTTLLSTIAGICYNAVLKERAKDAMVHYCLRVLVVSIILYDHVDPEGAFGKGSKVNIRASVRIIQTNGGSGSNNLLNALRYTTLHLNDETTPKTIKLMLAA
ncbi:Protein fam49a [Gaertneriomyces sp. JEL0708]|nr:Protein fam49a [Gaertneriomyces sp. JEL0708]